MEPAELLIRGIAGFLIVAASLVAGYRLHEAVETFTPLRLPRDMGAWCGLAFGLASAYAAL